MFELLAASHAGDTAGDCETAMLQCRFDSAGANFFKLPLGKATSGGPSEELSAAGRPDDGMGLSMTIH